MLHSYYFSASNTTERIVKAIAGNLGMDSACHNLTSPIIRDITTPAKDDTVIFASPVYAGRIPALAVEKFNIVKGNGQKCIAVAVYGNRDYDDALLELCDMLTTNGYDVVAAAAFVAQHSIFPKVAYARPDAADMHKIAEFCRLTRATLDNGRSLDINTVKGNRPYKKPAAIPLHPQVDNKRCVLCGKCARECPAGAISITDPHKTDTDKCIACSRCIVVCPDNARYFGGLKYKAIAPLFKQKCSARREPEWFVGQ